MSEDNSLGWVLTRSIGVLLGKQKPKLSIPQKPPQGSLCFSGKPLNSFSVPGSQLLGTHTNSLHQLKDPPRWLSYKSTCRINPVAALYSHEIAWQSLLPSLVASLCFACTWHIILLMYVYSVCGSFITYFWVCDHQGYWPGDFCWCCIFFCFCS